MLAQNDWLGVHTGNADRRPSDAQTGAPSAAGQSSDASEAAASNRSVANAGNSLQQYVPADRPLVHRWLHVTGPRPRLVHVTGL